jgi:septal ring factor EnvC (AmiA/AmiB activator)
MTKKDFFTKKIIPQIQEQIWTYEYHLIRSQFILDQLQKELELLETSQLYTPGENVEEVMAKKEREKKTLRKEIEEAKRNLQVLPMLKAGEERFLEFFKKAIKKL